MSSNALVSRISSLKSLELTLGYFKKSVLIYSSILPWSKCIASMLILTIKLNPRVFHCSICLIASSSTHSPIAILT